MYLEFGVQKACKNIRFILTSNNFSFAQLYIWQYFIAKYILKIVHGYFPLIFVKRKSVKVNKDSYNAFFVILFKSIIHASIAIGIYTTNNNNQNNNVRHTTDQSSPCGDH